MYIIKKIRLLLLFFTVYFFCACSKTPPLPAQTEFVLGTICSVNLYEQGTAKVYQEVFSRLREIEDRMSANKPETDIDRINQNAGIAPVQVHDDVIAVIQKALYYAELTDGAFDPTVGPLVSLWGIGFDNPHLPTEDELQQALSLINWHDVIVDADAKTVYLPHEGMKLDLGAIAKGYAADEVSRIIHEADIDKAIIDLGGNVIVIGSKEKNIPWRVGIQHVSGIRGEYLGVMSASDKTFVTSGVYERYFEQDGKHYHHILSTENGYPVDNDLLSVTIIADNSIDADALSTSIFALGYEKGYELADRLSSVEALFVFDDQTLQGTPEVFKSFELADKNFRLREQTIFSHALDTK
jgi:thiamine biosynthesis lipoprotein